jgi:hypothetical protein
MFVACHLCGLILNGMMCSNTTKHLGSCADCSMLAQQVLQTTRSKCQHAAVMTAWVQHSATALCWLHTSPADILAERASQHTCNCERSCSSDRLLLLLLMPLLSLLLPPAAADDRRLDPAAAADMPCCSCCSDLRLCPLLATPAAAARLLPELPLLGVAAAAAAAVAPAARAAASLPASISSRWPLSPSSACSCLWYSSAAAAAATAAAAAAAYFIGTQPAIWSCVSCKPHVQQRCYSACWSKCESTQAHRAVNNISASHLG